VFDLAGPAGCEACCEAGEHHLAQQPDEADHQPVVDRRTPDWMEIGADQRPNRSKYQDETDDPTQVCPRRQLKRATGARNCLFDDPVGLSIRPHG
jgi:hypothetical protein